MDGDRQCSEYKNGKRFGKATFISEEEFITNHFYDGEKRTKGKDITETPELAFYNWVQNGGQVQNALSPDWKNSM